jgi:hypothetical protein
MRLVFQTEDAGNLVVCVDVVCEVENNVFEEKKVGERLLLETTCVCCCTKPRPRLQSRATGADEVSELKK